MLSVIFQSCIFQTHSFFCPSFSGRAFSASPAPQHAQKIWRSSDVWFSIHASGQTDTVIAVLRSSHPCRAAVNTDLKRRRRFASRSTCCKQRRTLGVIDSRRPNYTDSICDGRRSAPNKQINSPADRIRMRRVHAFESKLETGRNRPLAHNSTHSRRYTLLAVKPFTAYSRAENNFISYIVTTP